MDWSSSVDQPLPRREPQVRQRSVVTITEAESTTDLAPDLAGWKGSRVEVRVGRIALQGVHDRLEIPRSHALRRGSYHVGGTQRPGHCSILRLALLSPRWSGHVRAEEHHDATGHVNLAEMNVGLGDPRGQAGILEGERQRLIRPVEPQHERGPPIGQNGSGLPSPQPSYFVETREHGVELFDMI